MAMLMTPLAIVGIAKMAIPAMAIGVINMVILGIQLKGTKQLAQWCSIHSNRTFRSDIINIFVIL